MLLLLQSYCPSSPSHHIATPLPARCTLLPSPPSHTATSPPPSPHVSHCYTPHMCPIVVHLTAAWPHYCPLAATHTTSPLPAHVAPLAATHAASPHASQHGHVTSSLTVAHVTSPHTSLLHRPRHPPHSHTCHHPSPTCMGHIAAPITAAHITSPHTSSWHGPHCPPCSHTCCVTVHLVVAWATLPPLQLHMLHHCVPCHCTGHISPLTATHAVSPHASQPHRPHRCPPRSHTPRHTPHSCMGHIAAHLVAACHVAAPLAVLAPGPTGYCL